MFDHYMTYQHGDPRRRLRLQIAAASSGVITFSLVAFMWVANKLNITRVDPPPGIEFIMTQLVEEEAVAAVPPPNRTLEEIEIDMIRAALDAAGGNISEASKRLGISRNTIYRKLRWNRQDGDVT